MIYLDEPNLDYIPSTRGDHVQKFEKAMAGYFGVKDCVATNSGTSALHLSLLACGVGKGNTVVVPATTFVATANAVLYTGAKIKLRDVDFDTWAISGSIKSFRVDTVIYVSLYGGIKANITNRYSDTPIVFDYAEAICANDLDLDDYSFYCFSFNGNKTMTTGAGGLIVGKDLSKIRYLMKPGICNKLAYNYGMPAICAKLGLEQIFKLQDNLKRKQEINSIYREQLYMLRFQGNAPGPFWMTVCLFPEWIDIPSLQLDLKIKGIPTRRVFKPLNHYDHLKDGKTYPNAEYIYKHGLVLPSSVKNEDADIYQVCNAIKELI